MICFRKAAVSAALLATGLLACTGSAPGGNPDTGGGDTSGGAGTGGAPSGSGGTAAPGAGSAGAGGNGGVATGAGGRAGATGGAGSGGAGGAPTTSGPTGFIIGADMSDILQKEDRGMTFRDNGQVMDVLAILKNHGFNYIRLRMFNDPRAPGGYSAQGYDDLPHTITMGKRIKALGLGFQLDFHYSDTWADPGDQVIPAAWRALALPALVQAVHDFTQDAVAQLIANAAAPDIVQIGNEITPGFLLPLGGTANWDNLASLLNAGVRGVKDAGSAARIMMHIDRGGDNGASRYWFDNAISHGVVFDIIGQSCYTTFQGPPAGWQANFADLVTRYPDKTFLIAEYSQEKRAANDTMWNLPNNRGLGTIIWEPSHWLERIFDNNGATIPAMMAIYDAMKVAYAGR